MTTNMDRISNFKLLIRRMAIGASLGIAWGATLRAWMALLALKFGGNPQFTWEGTFGAILFPTALVGTILGGATYVAESSDRKRWRWATLLPLLLIVGPAVFGKNFIPNLVTTGLGGGAIAVALIGILGGYAFSGFGVKWTHWVTGILSLFLTLGIMAYELFFPTASAAVSPGVSEVFGALLFVLLMALLIAGISAPSRYKIRQPS